jgi:hypothetical protein
MARGIAIVADVATYVEEHRGELITLEQLRDYLPDGVNDGSIQRVMLELVRRDVGLECLNQGKVWRLSSKPQKVQPVAEPVAKVTRKAPPVKLVAPKTDAYGVPLRSANPAVGSLLEVIGTTRNGILLRDETGAAWSATRM